MSVIHSIKKIVENIERTLGRFSLRQTYGSIDTFKRALTVKCDTGQTGCLLCLSRLRVELFSTAALNSLTGPPPTKVEGISGLERLRRTVGPFPTEVGGFKPDFWKMKNYFCRKPLITNPGKDAKRQTQRRWVARKSSKFSKTHCSNPKQARIQRTC